MSPAHIGRFVAYYRVSTDREGGDGYGMAAPRRIHAPDIDIVNERDVDPIHAKPVTALLKVAHRAVVAVIVDSLEIEPADELPAIDLFAALGF